MTDDARDSMRRRHAAPACRTSSSACGLRTGWRTSRPGRSRCGDACPFCAAPEMSDEDALIVARGHDGVRAAQPLPVQLRPPARLPLSPHRDLRRGDRRRGRRDRRAHPDRRCGCCATVSRCDGFNIGMNQGQHRRRGHRRAPAPAHRAAVGARTRTSSRSSPRPRPCRSCSARCARAVADAWHD